MDLRRIPAGRPIPRRWIPQQVRRRHRHHEKQEREDLERGAPTHVLDQRRPDRAEQTGACTKAADHEADDQAPFVGKPFRSHGGGHNVTEAAAGPGNDARGHVKHDQRLREAGKEQAGGE